jgi:ribonuclease D
MDRRTERRVERLKSWRATRAKELELDPGVLCPNTGLEAIAWRDPSMREDLAEVPELKRWFISAFSQEIIDALRDGSNASDDSDNSEDAC